MYFIWCKLYSIVATKTSSIIQDHVALIGYGLATLSMGILARISGSFCGVPRVSMNALHVQAIKSFSDRGLPPYNSPKP